ncbi:CUB and sushi domain-containing protein 1-like [Gigantopelta aegis]|uniref:CUB and sushi domain-containing protein 1-like n=1 Tax=Gigantopelta aegis TaxID=1735272 RepID=UPI001B88D6E2|nr:CUB and sushi domain-containing protein 1-like [Gigantopelta aegis]
MPIIPRPSSLQLNALCFVFSFSVQVQFLSLDTEPGLDFVEVWVGGRTLSSSRLIRRLSGSTPPPDDHLLSSNNMAIIRFVSDLTKHYAGFRLKWRADFECGFENVPDSYYADTDIKSTSLFRSTVEACKLECLNSVACAGFSFNHNTKQCRVLSEMPRPVTDSCCELYFKTCPDQTSYAIVSSMPNLGGKLSASSSGTRLPSPLYPFYYLGGLDIAWTITSPGRRIVTLEMLDLDLASADYVSVYDGDGPASPLITMLFDESSDAHIMSTGTVMYIYYHSSYYSHNKRGFLFRYRAGKYSHYKRGFLFLYHAGKYSHYKPGFLFRYRAVQQLQTRLSLPVSRW